MTAKLKAVRRGVGVLALAAAGFLAARTPAEPLAAEPSKDASKYVPVKADAAKPEDDASKRVVAYIYGDTPLTREQFGEYLIQRLGAERVRLFVNKMIIDRIAADKKIVVTHAEVDAKLDEFCKNIGVNRDEFVKTIVKQRYGRNIDEYREDVLKPGMQLERICDGLVTISDDDLRKKYENLFGPRVQVQIIIWPKADQKRVADLWDKIRNDGDAYDSAAKTQSDARLASRKGLVDPIGKFGGPQSEVIEKEAFKLKPGEVSHIIDTPMGLLVMRCVELLPNQYAKMPFETVKPELEKMVRERKLEEVVPKYFAGVQKEARPIFFLSPSDVTRAELEEQLRAFGGIDPTRGK